MILPPTTLAWSNGDAEDVYYGDRFGSHDWIAHQAMLLLPAVNRSWYTGELVTIFLVGTHAPDDSSVDMGNGLVGYGDTPNHHNYYSADYSTLIDDDASVRAQEEFDKAIAALGAGNFSAALFYAGSMIHYLSDLAIWGHTMTGEANHSNFEDSVNNKMDVPTEEFFTVTFDGEYTTHTAHQAAFLMGQETYGNGSGTYNATWMDDNYAPFGFKTEPETTFDFRMEYLVNMVVNLGADVLFQLFGNYAGAQPPGIDPVLVLLIASIVIAGLVALVIVIIKYT